MIETLKRKKKPPVWKRLADVLVGVGVGVMASSAKGER